MECGIFLNQSKRILSRENDKRNCRQAKILLIEGIPGAGKTTLVKSLLTNYIGQNEKIRTLIYLGQSHTYDPLVSDEENFYAGKEENQIHLEKIFDLLCWHSSVINKNKTNRKGFCVIDTLHITHCFRPGSISWKDVMEYDRQLADINCKLIFLKALPQTILNRSIIPRSKRDELYLSKYQKRYGNSLEKVHEYYMDEQDKMEELIKLSALRKITLHSEETLQTNTDAAYNFCLQKDT